MKTGKLFLLIAFIGMMTMNSAQAQTVIASGDCGANGNNITWTLTSDSVLTISGTGAMADFSSVDDVPWLYIRDGIKTGVIEDGVTTVGDRAFSTCSSLTSVTIPNSVTTIGEWFFSGCTSLTSVTIGNSVTAIGNYAFGNCTRLTSITCKTAAPPALLTASFDNVDKSIPVYVPCGTVEAYQAAWGWRDFINYQEREAVTPQNIRVAQITGAFEITWQGEAASYQLYRNGALLETVTGSAYTDTGVTVGTEYCYKVKSAGAGCESEFSADTCLVFRLSSNASLATLTVSEGELTPAFNSDTLGYTVNVINSVASIDISATANDTGASVTGTGTQTLQVGENTFNITVTAEDGTSTRIYTVTVNRADATGISDLSQAAQLKIYPNPVKDRLSIENGVSTALNDQELRVDNVEIVDLSGRAVISTSLNDRSVNVSHLSSGIYFIKIETDKGTVTEKFVKE
jgi:hypothetical protein